MTSVETTPPPRLPVRDREAARAQFGALSPMLARLATEHATGTLHREHGTLHLADGGVVHAESPSAPGIEVLLAGPAPSDPAPLPDRFAQGALELCRLEALYDAAYFALAPSSTPGRFRFGTPPPAGGGRAVPVAVLERAVVRRRAVLHRIWPDPRTDGTALVRTDAGAHPARSVTARQRAVLDRVDGVRTAPDIAWELGRQAFHTLVDVRRLAAAGLVRPQPPPASAEPPPAEGAPPPADDPHIILLKRLRDALEAL
ncbi:transcriptional regulator [Streptomyces sp. NPDC088387]|uniref:transcriptional regulator n=1 Tax=Streptomyces sp. NPDC088387 TaxID=3365859 RepID=UPI0038251552